MSVLSNVFQAVRQLVTRFAASRKALFATGVAVIGLVSGVLGIYDFVSKRQGESENGAAAPTAPAEPAWVTSGCDAYWPEPDADRLCAVGIAKISGSLSIARTQALSRARAEIARILESRVDATVELRDTLEQEEFESTSTQLSRATLTGTRLVDSWKADDGMLHVLVAVEPTGASPADPDGTSAPR